MQGVSKGQEKSEMGNAVLTISESDLGGNKSHVDVEISLDGGFDPKNEKTWCLAHMLGLEAAKFMKERYEELQQQIKDKRAETTP